PIQITTIYLSDRIKPFYTAALLSGVGRRWLTSNASKMEMCYGEKTGLFVTFTWLALLAGGTILHARPTVPEPGSSPRQSANASQSALQKDGRIRRLEPGQSIEREIAGGESHAYQLTLASGQYARVIVDQRGIDVAVTVYGTDGEKIIESDVAEIGEAEEVSLVADVAANFQLEVQAPGKTAPKGRYEIKIKEWRAATERDRNRVAAEKAVAEAIRLYNRQTADSLRKAIEKFQESLTF